MNENKQTGTLVSFVRNALLNDWDPIGVKSIPEAVDEYDGYVPQICQLIIKGNKQKLVDHLWWIETERMGLTGNRKATEAFAERLLK